ncbi:MAG: IS66 family insertion sequence element accessory protein TnpB [Sphingobacteriales bacterium]|nr:IS66 family insertion sequence element accessory protein TnpB [Sphingobacteriales bacterium]
MLHLNSACRYFYYNGTADFRKGAYGLSGLVRNEMQQDVLSGDVFIFIGRRGNKIKLLQWDSDGFALYEKGLEQGTFERPPASHNDHFCITSQQLQFILQGVILKTVRQKSGLPANNSTIAILSEIPVNTAFQAIISMIFVLPVNILQTVSHIASGNSFIDYKILFEQERSHNIELRLQIQSLQLQLAELKKMLFGGRGREVCNSKCNRRFTA